MPDELADFLAKQNQSLDVDSQRQAIETGASALGINPVDYATAISYESAKTFDPWAKGTTTKWGLHRGTIQYGEPQRKQYGVYEGQTFEDQVTNSNVKYLKDHGVQPGMTFVQVYKAINAGNVNADGGTPDAKTGRTVGDNIRNAERDHRAYVLQRFWNGRRPQDDLAKFVGQTQQPDELAQFLASQPPINGTTPASDPLSPGFQSTPDPEYMKGLERPADPPFALPEVTNATHPYPTEAQIQELTDAGEAAKAGLPAPPEPITRNYVKRDLSQLGEGEQFYKFEQEGKTSGGDEYLGQVGGSYHFRDKDGDEFYTEDPAKGEVKYIGERKKAYDADKNEYVLADQHDAPPGAVRRTRTVDGKPVDYLFEGSRIREEFPKLQFKDGTVQSEDQENIPDGYIRMEKGDEKFFAKPGKKEGEFSIVAEKDFGKQGVGQLQTVKQAQTHRIALKQDNVARATTGNVGVSVDSLTPQADDSRVTEVAPDFTAGGYDEKTNKFIDQSDEDVLKGGERYALNLKGIDPKERQALALNQVFTRMQKQFGVREDAREGFVTRGIKQKGVQLPDDANITIDRQDIVNMGGDPLPKFRERQRAAQHDVYVPQRDAATNRTDYVPQGQNQVETTGNPLLDQAARNVMNNPLSGGTDEDVQAEYARLKRVALSDEEKAEAEAVGKSYAQSGAGGTATESVIGGGGRLIDALSGLFDVAENVSGVKMVRNLGEKITGTNVGDDELKIRVARFASKMRLSAETEAGINTGIGSKALRTVVGLGADIPRYILLGTIPGGMPVMFAVDAGLQSVGRGETVTETVKEVAKGAATGLIFGGATKLARMVEAGTLSKILGGVQIGDKTLLASRGSQRLAGQVFGIGTKIGSVLGGTATEARISGQSPADSLEAGITNSILILALEHGGDALAGVKKLAGKIFRGKMGGETKTVTVDENGDIHELKKAVPDEAVDVNLAIAPKPVAQESRTTESANKPPKGGEVRTGEDGTPMPKAELKYGRTVRTVDIKGGQIKVVTGAHPNHADDPNVLSISAYKPETDELVGEATFDIGGLGVQAEKGKTVQATDLWVNSEVGGENWRRRGVATALYNEAERLGYRPIPATDGRLKPDGASFWESRRNAAPTPEKPTPEAKQQTTEREAAGGASDAHLDAPDFQTFFKNSKAVDASGDPKPLYHGTNKAIETFTASRGGGRLGEDQLEGVHLTSSKDAAKFFSGAGGKPSYIYEMYASLQNPFEATDLADLKKQLGVSSGVEATKILKERGYDGAIFTEGFQYKGGTPDEVIVFDPRQIRRVADVKEEPITPKTNISSEGDKPIQSHEGQYESVTRINRKSVTTERGTKATVEPKVIDASDILTSLDEGYPAELQPRDRSRAASKAQISRIANNLKPEFLDDSPKASDGRPLVVPVEVGGKTKYAVVSGNGRVEAIRHAYEIGNDPSQAYAEFTQGKQAHSLKNPVYVAELKDVKDLPAFAREANESAVAQMSATERAQGDAEKLDAGLLSKFVPSEDGSIHSAANREFIKDFIQKAVPENEQGALVDENGQLSQEGNIRVRNAIFAKAFGEDAVHRLAESTDDNIKRVTNALLKIAPKIVDLKEHVDAGSRHPGLDISDGVAAALSKYSHLRSEKTDVATYLKQQSLFGDELSPLQKRILTEFDNYKNSSTAISGILNNYLALAHELGDPNQTTLFGEPIEANSATIFKESVLQYERGKQFQAPQPSLLDPNKRREAQSETSRPSEKTEPEARTERREGGPEPQNAPAEIPKELALFAKNKIVTPDKIEAARDVLKGIQFNSGLDPAQYKALLTIGAGYVEAGARSLATFTAKMADEFGEGIKKHVEKLYGDIRDEHGFEGMDKPESGSSIMNSAVNADRASRGWEKLSTKLKLSNPELHEQAKKVIADDPQAPLKTFEKFLHHPDQAPSKVENVLLNAHYLSEKADWNGMVNRYTEAMDSEDPLKMADAEMERKVADAKLDEVERVLLRAGTESGQALQSRQMFADDDFEFVRLAKNYKMAKGREPSSDELKTLQQIADEHKAKTEALEAVMADKDRELAEIKAQIPPRHILDVAEKYVGKLKTLADKERARINAKGNVFQANIDPRDLKSFAIIGADHLATMGLDFAKWSDKMLNEVEEKYREQLKPYLGKIFDDAQKVLKGGHAALSSDADIISRTLKAQKTRMENRIKELESAINKKERITRIRKITTPDAEIERLQEQVKSLKEDYDAIFPPASRPQMTDAQRLQALEKRLGKKQKTIEDKVAAGDFSDNAKRAPLNPLEVKQDTSGKYTKEDRDRANRIVTAQAEVGRIEKRYARMKRQAERVKEPLAKWGMRKATNFVRGSMLSSITVFEKLGAASIGRTLTSPIKTAIGYGVSKVMPNIARKAAIEGSKGLVNDVLIEANAMAKGWTTGIMDIGRTLKGKGTDLSNAYSKTENYLTPGRYLPVEVSQLIGLAHEALKAPAFRNEYERVLGNLIADAKLNGHTVDNETMFLLGQKAYQYAQRIKFQENSIVSTKINEVMRKFDNSELTAVQAIGAFMHIVMPIHKISTNVIKQSFESSPLGLGKGIIKAIGAKMEGLDSLTPDQADIIMRNIKHGTFGSALYALGLFVGGKVIGSFYQQYDKDKDKEVAKYNTMQIDGVRIPSALLHLPEFNSMFMGATTKRIYEESLKKNHKDVGGAAARGVGAGIRGLVEEVPGLEAADALTNIYHAVLGGSEEDLRESRYGVGNFVSGRVVPGAVRNLAEALDQDPKGHFITPFTREPLHRKTSTKTFGQSIKTQVQKNIPWWRNQLPNDTP